MEDTNIPQNEEKLKAIVVLSGGLDSTTALYWALVQYDVVGAISFNYGQKHSEELKYAERTISKLNEQRVKAGENKINYRVQEVPISAERSSLTNKDKEIPHGHYEADNMKATVVNNRNSIMFSLATAWAIDLKANRVIVGIHSGDHAIYPDCRTEYIRQFNKAMRLANEGFIEEDFRIEAPFVDITKSDIAELFLLLGGDESETYSDYEGGKVQKGRSGTSVERIEAISDAYYRFAELIKPYTESHQMDKTKYEEKEYALNLLKEKVIEKRTQEMMDKIENDLNRNYGDRTVYNHSFNMGRLLPLGISIDSTEAECDEDCTD